MIKARRNSIRDDIEINICDIIESWLIDNENRNVELNELMKILNLSFYWIFKFDASSIAICWCCEIFVIWLTEEQNRNVELNELIKTTNLNDLNDLSDIKNLIDNLIELYSFAFVNDVSTRIFLLIWSTSAATRYFDSNQSIEARFLILDLINDVKFVSSAICEILASWLIEK